MTFPSNLLSYLILLEVLPTSSIMQFKAAVLLVAALLAGAMASPIPADVPCKRARLENRQEPCCCG
ncbi:hypothetical protein K466DRAFT_597213 [Polyporus arcularius HHB13444]|uniref:Uncharacterized protein n=1 Tax=Polyporus arcularius HHB13444 TaxID=1314778 RepID=A0A5C3PJZ7_9APHY|nr:hypothetical protein K466DRAFT_597213 [Polyporus arcularius HHB13444]